MPRDVPPKRCRAPQIEEVPDEDLTQAHSKLGIPECSLEWGTNAESEEWHTTEVELEEWCREIRRLRREEAIKQQKERDTRQQERRKVWEKEEEQRDAEWIAWLRRQRAEPGLRKWFFWRNRFKSLNPPRRLSVDSLGGGSAPPSRESYNPTIQKPAKRGSCQQQVEEQEGEKELKLCLRACGRTQWGDLMNPPRGKS
ncbi:hypothetical protein GG344DRAFT_60922 [Lentinula edodes]|nr:hypothetical protein GG344DRAFT_60922 [Lentinula edodes]